MKRLLRSRTPCFNSERYEEQLSKRPKRKDLRRGNEFDRTFQDFIFIPRLKNLMKPAKKLKNIWIWQADKLEKARCPLCEASSYKNVYLRNDGLNIVGCLECSFKFIQTRPVQSELNRFYDSGYFAGAHDFYRGEDYFRSRKKGLENERINGWFFLKKHCDFSNRRVLDLGCADGALLVLAKKYGASQVVGVEINSQAASLGREQFGLEILESSVEPLPFQEDTFDVVTAFDLIEHVRCPRQLFREINRVLCPQGIFVGACPDMDCFADWGNDWIGVRRNFEHLNYFDTGILLKLANQTGLKVNLIEYEGFPLELRQYNRLLFPGTPFLVKALQPWVWIFNAWQKKRFQEKKTEHKHSLLFIFEKM